MSDGCRPRKRRGCDLVSSNQKHVALTSCQIFFKTAANQEKAVNEKLVFGALLLWDVPKTYVLSAFFFDIWYSQIIMKERCWFGTNFEWVGAILAASVKTNENCEENCHAVPFIWIYELSDTGTFVPVPFLRHAGSRYMDLQIKQSIFFCLWSVCLSLRERELLERDHCLTFVPRPFLPFSCCSL